MSAEIVGRGSSKEDLRKGRDERQSESTDTHCRRANRMKRIQSEPLTSSLVTPNKTHVVSGGMYIHWASCKPQGHRAQETWREHPGDSSWWRCKNLKCLPSWGTGKAQVSKLSTFVPPPVVLPLELSLCGVQNSYTEYSPRPRPGRDWQDRMARESTSVQVPQVRMIAKVAIGERLGIFGCQRKHLRERVREREIVIPGPQITLGIGTASLW